MEASDNAFIPSALHTSTNSYPHTWPFCAHKVTTAGIFSVLFGFSSPPDHEKGTTSKKSSKRTCHLNQSRACSPAFQRACLLQHLQLITLYPNGTKLARLNHQEMGGSIFSNFNNIHVRNKQEKNYKQYPLAVEKA